MKSIPHPQQITFKGETNTKGENKTSSGTPCMLKRQYNIQYCNNKRKTYIIFIVVLRILIFIKFIHQQMHSLLNLIKFLKFTFKNQFDLLLHVSVFKYNHLQGAFITA